MLKMLGVGSAGAILAACAPGTTATPGQQEDQSGPGGQEPL